MKEQEEKDASKEDGIEIFIRSTRIFEVHNTTSYEF